MGEINNLKSIKNLNLGMNQPTLGGFESLLDGNNIMVYLVVLLPGHLQTCLQVLLQVLHSFLHHVPKTLRDLAHGGQLVQCELLVANLALVSRESTMKISHSSIRCTT